MVLIKLWSATGERVKMARKLALHQPIRVRRSAAPHTLPPTLRTDIDMACANAVMADPWLCKAAANSSLLSQQHRYVTLDMVVQATNAPGNLAVSIVVQ